MEELLTQYTLTEVILMAGALAVIVKNVITYFDWGSDRLGKVFSSKYENNKRSEDIQSSLNNIQETIEEVAGHLVILDEKVDELTSAEKEDIKADLTKEHHYFCYQKGWIDDYSLECCEKKYAFYKDHGGNSFIRGFMEDLRALPKQPPQNSK